MANAPEHYTPPASLYHPPPPHYDTHHPLPVPDSEGLQTKQECFDREPGISVVPVTSPHTPISELPTHNGQASWRRRRICAIPVLLLIALVILLVIGAAVGGAVGGIKSKDVNKDDAIIPPPPPISSPSTQSTPTRITSNPSSTGTTTSSPTITPHPQPERAFYQLTNHLVDGDTTLALQCTTDGHCFNVTSTSGDTLEFWLFMDPLTLNLTAVKESEEWSRAYRLANSIRTPLYIVGSKYTPSPEANGSIIRLNENTNQIYMIDVMSMMYDDPAIWWWLEDRYDGKGDFYLKNAAAGTNMALTIYDARTGRTPLYNAAMGIVGEYEILNGSQGWTLVRDPDSPGGKRSVVRFAW